jgi:ribosome-associated heat shock protein Hsp15
VVFNGEEILIRKNQINYQIIILDIPKNRIGAKLVDLYRKDITPKEEFERQELLKYSKDYYRKSGIGRPTKKDRRDIDNFNTEE